MKKITLAVATAALLLAACGHQNSQATSTKTSTSKTVTTSVKTKPKYTEKQAEDLIWYSEYLGFYTITVKEEGKYYVANNDQNDGKKVYLSTDGNEFYGMDANGVKTQLDLSNSIDIQKGMVPLKQYYENQPKDQIEFDHKNGNVIVYHVFEDMKDHIATIDWVDYNPDTKTYVSDINANDPDYSSING